jgi:hypothetical protein
MKYREIVSIRVNIAFWIRLSDGLGFGFGLHMFE